ncbi:MAG: thioredoxin [Candidatus Hydrothermarchaeaceae archaeon]
MSHGKIIQLTDADFESTIEKIPLVLVDFWAAWCFPCQMVAPIIDEMAEAYSEDLVCAKLDVDKNPITATKFSITGIPTILLFKDGELVERIVGAVSKERFEEKIKAHL